MIKIFKYLHFIFLLVGALSLRTDNKLFLGKDSNIKATNSDLNGTNALANVIAKAIATALSNTTSFGDITYVCNSTITSHKNNVTNLPISNATIVGNATNTCNIPYVNTTISSVSNDTIIQNTTNICNATNIGNATVVCNTTIISNPTIEGNITFFGDTKIVGNVSIVGNITIIGNAYFFGNITIITNSTSSMQLNNTDIFECFSDEINKNEKESDKKRFPKCDKDQRFRPKLAYWIPISTGTWPTLHSFKATDAITNQVLHEEKQKKAFEENEDYVERMIAKVAQKGYYFSTVRLKAIAKYYKQDFKSLQDRMNEGIFLYEKELEEKKKMQ